MLLKMDKIKYYTLKDIVNNIYFLFYKINYNLFPTSI